MKLFKRSLILLSLQPTLSLHLGTSLTGRRPSFTTQNLPKTLSASSSTLSRSYGTCLRTSSIAAEGGEKNGMWSKIKSVIPPENERKKVMPLAFMFFCILFNYTILRDTKDVLMITAPGSGAEVIPFIKTYVNLPAAIGFTGIYAKMCDSMDTKNVFYACVMPFLIFFSVFALGIYPNRGAIHPVQFVEWASTVLPAGFSPVLAIVQNWSFALFYVMAEMWGSVVSSLLFWGFANEVTTVDEAKKYYPLFGLGANVR